MAARRSKRLQNHVITALTNGVSRQAPQLRLESQGEEQINYISDVTVGLVDRPPVEFVATTNFTNPSLYDNPVFTYTVRDDVNGDYQIIIPGDGSLRTVNLADGVVTQVETGNAYLTSSTPSTTFKAKSTADTTFIVNSEIDVAYDTSVVSDGIDNTALFWAKQTAQRTNFYISMRHNYDGPWRGLSNHYAVVSEVVDVAPTGVWEVEVIPDAGFNPTAATTVTFDWNDGVAHSETANVVNWDATNNILRIDTLSDTIAGGATVTEAAGDGSDTGTLTTTMSQVEDTSDTVNTSVDDQVTTRVISILTTFETSPSYGHRNGVSTDILARDIHNQMVRLQQDHDNLNYELNGQSMATWTSTLGDGSTFWVTSNDILYENTVTPGAGWAPVAGDAITFSGGAVGTVHSWVGLEDKLKWRISSGTVAGGETATVGGNTATLAAEITEEYPDEGVRFQTGDGLGNEAFKCAHISVESLNDLPDSGAPTGFRIKVDPSGANEIDDYYLEFNGSTWVETVGYSLYTDFDATTMPHALVRDAGNGSFDFIPYEWSSRTAGDDATNPAPSFLNNKIQDIIFYKNRLGFLLEDGAVFSDATDVSNFWLTTVRQILPTDPVDIKIDGGSRTPRYRNFHSLNGTLLAMGSGSQALIKGTDVFSADTATADVVSQIDYNDTIAPLTTGTSLLLQDPESSTKTSFLEYFPGDESAEYAYADISRHIDDYLPTGIYWQASSPSAEVAVFGTGTNEIYVFKWFMSGGERVQSSFSKFSFDPNFKIVSADFIGKKLYLTIDRFRNFFTGTTNIQLRAIDIAVIDFDANDDDLRMDYRLDATVGPESTVNPNQFPVSVPGTLVNLTVGPQPDDVMQGIILYTADGRNLTDFTYSHTNDFFGDPVVQITITDSDIEEGDTVNFGLKINRRYEPTTYRPRVETETGVVQLAQGRVQVRRVKFGLVDGVWLKAEAYRGDDLISTRYYDHRKYDGSNGVIGNAKDFDTFQLDVGANAEELQVVITNDTPWITKLTSIGWETLYFNRSENV